MGAIHPESTLPEDQWHDYNAGNLAHVPQKPGIYFLGYGRPPRKRYVGKSDSNIQARLQTYQFADDRCHNEFIRQNKPQAFKFKLCGHAAEVEALLLRWFREYDPECINRRHELRRLSDQIREVQVGD